MRWAWRFFFRVAGITSLLLLVWLAGFNFLAEPTQGNPGILFFKTPWGVMRVYAEQTLHISWLHPWPDSGGSKWGVRCGQIDLSSGHTDAILVGQQRNKWIGDIALTSGQFVPVAANSSAVLPMAGGGMALRWDVPILLMNAATGPGLSGTISVQMAFVPWWEVYVALAVLPGIWVIRSQVKKLRAGASREGFCTVCGYDLRATPGRCPECGNVVKGMKGDVVGGDGGGGVANQ
jgi:hypothetical protein